MEDLSKQFNDLNNFVYKMKHKIQSKKYKHMEDDLNVNYVKLYLIDEFCELFMLDSVDRYTIKEFFINREIDRSELVDLADMCWALDFAIRKEERENTDCKDNCNLTDNQIRMRNIMNFFRGQ